VAGAVAAPLGLRATVPDSFGRVIADRATLYTIADGEVTEAPPDDLSSRWSGGGYLSSTEDLSRLGDALLQVGYLSRASLDALFTSQHLSDGSSTEVGIGWRIGRDAKGRRIYHHGGTSNGGTAFLLVYPDEGLVVAMAANAFARWSTPEAQRVAELFLSRDES